MGNDLQDLYRRFDGTGNSDTRLAWYGQCRAKGLSHSEAVLATYDKFSTWCNDVWPRRGIALPEVTLVKPVI